MENIKRIEPQINFHDAYQKWKAQNPEASESAEPAYCECGELRIIAESEMQLDVLYCDGFYTYRRSENCKRRYKLLDGTWRTHTVTEPHVYYVSDCPAKRSVELKEKAEAIRSEYKTLGGLPMDFDSYEPEANLPAYNAARAFAESIEPKKKLAIVGPAGRGKTHLARGIHIYALQTGFNSHWIRASDFSDMIRRMQSFNQNEHDQRLNERKWDALIAASCVVIDDLGSERKTESDLFVEQLKNFLEKFNGALIYTTNLDGKEMQSRYDGKEGNKITGRLWENLEVIRMTTLDTDYRAKSFKRG